MHVVFRRATEPAFPALGSELGDAIGPGTSSRGEDSTRLLVGTVLFLSVVMLPGCASSLGARRDAGIRPPDGPARVLLIRTDDAGMSHSVNVALERLLATGMPVSVSVMPPTPWFTETVALLKRYPHVSTGIHLTLNSEWRQLRWGPVAGAGTVPSLVDTLGYFFPSGEALARNNPDPRDVETELRAQIRRALQSGLRIDYVDYHMGTAIRYPAMREVTERLAREFGLGMSGYFGERMQSPQYAAAPAHKLDSLLVMMARLGPATNVVITHVGIDDGELGALLDMNTEQPLPDMSTHRQAELDALTSAAFTRAVQSHGITLLTYRQLIDRQGLHAMQRPAP